MRYWAYIDKKVCGPFEKEKLAELPNFSPSFLLCPDSPDGGQANAWKAASAFPDVLAALSPAPAPAQSRKPAAESPLLMTMRGTLIDEPVIDPPTQPRKPAVESPLMMTMRGTLIEEPAGNAPAAEPPKEKYGVELPARVSPAPGNAAGKERDQSLDPVKQKLEQMSAMLVSIGNTQSQLLERLGRVESALADMKAQLPPARPSI